MQIFIPYQSPLECAKALWNDSKRYNKQLIEAKQILAAIDGAKAWKNHPVCLMYKPYRAWLICYMECLNNFSKYKKGLGKSVFGENEYYLLSIQYNIEANKILPQFITDELCDHHKRRLYTKSPELYPQFAEYGTSEENWYYVSGADCKICKWKTNKLKIMDYSKETFPLNHFILWCKGWYRPTNEKATLEETLKIVFELDGYPFAKRMNDFLTIVLTEFDPYYKWLSEYNKRYCTIQMLCQNAINFETYNEMHGCSVSFAECMFYAIVDFFRYIDNKDIKLKKPIYNRELRNKGLCFRQSFRKDYQGMTYAEQNRIASKIFDK